MRSFLLFLCALSLTLTLGACATKMEQLSDSDVLPPGTSIEFWVDHDDHGWQRSKLHILRLPRAMTGAEARLWAEGTGRHDAGMKWTRYYVLATLPEPYTRQLRSPIYIPRAGTYIQVSSSDK